MTDYDPRDPWWTIVGCVGIALAGVLLAWLALGLLREFGL